jgi:hypothetical protein
LPASSPNLVALLDPQVLRRTSSLKVAEEQRRRRESREHAAIERDFEKLRRQQTGRGGLLNFVRYFWHTLEPKTRALVEGWPLEAICLHLEALTFGDIPSNRLLMNVPPGFMKSLLVNVFWPAWEWGPCDMPYMRYISFSYSDEITTRDNNKMVRLIQSPGYRQLWGDRFTLTKTGERRLENDQTGFKLATSCGRRLHRRARRPHPARRPPQRHQGRERSGARKDSPVRPRIDVEPPQRRRSRGRAASSSVSIGSPT